MLLNVFRTVGEIADRVSRRRLEALPPMVRRLEVLSWSLGRLAGGGCETVGEEGSMASEVVMVEGVMCSCDCEGGGGLDMAIIMCRSEDEHLAREGVVSWRRETEKEEEERKDEEEECERGRE